MRKLGWKQGIVYCSRACKETAYKAELRRAREQAKPPRKCRHCGGFMSKRMRSDAFYCSPECNSHAHHQTRKASAKIGARQERIDRAYIIQRDGSRCHICGEVVSGRRLTIDHVVPLAKGGMHAEHNLAVACLSCNCAKGAR